MKALGTVAVVVVVPGAIVWGSDWLDSPTDRDEWTAAYCAFGAVSEAQFYGCVDHVAIEDIEPSNTAAAVCAREGGGDTCGDAGPFGRAGLRCVCWTMFSKTSAEARHEDVPVAGVLHRPTRRGESGGATVRSTATQASGRASGLGHVRHVSKPASAASSTSRQSLLSGSTPRSAIAHRRSASSATRPVGR